jgi:hypothetical protein
VQSFLVVDVLDECRQAVYDIVKGLASRHVDLLGFQRDHEAFHLCVVKGISGAAQGATQACCFKGITIGLSGVLTIAFGAIDAALRALAAAGCRGPWRPPRFGV